MYDSRDPPNADGPPPPPPTAVPPILMPSGPRYGYLAGRLRNRQITMEEATELFGLLQESLATARQALVQMAPPVPSRVGPRAVRPREAAGARPSLALRDEDLALGMLALGAGAGLLAAILKRSAEGPRSTGSK